MNTPESRTSSSMSIAQRYVSADLTHFVGRALPTDEDRYLLLKTILDAGELKNPNGSKGPGLMMGVAAGGGVAGEFSVRDGGRISDDELHSLSAVCFCDIPVDDLEIHMQKYSRTGLAFPKAFLIRHDARPVWYLPKSSRPAPFFLDFSGSSLSQRFDGLLPRMTHRYGSLIKSLVEGPLKGKDGVVNLQKPSRAQGEMQALVEELIFFQTEMFSFMKFYDADTVDEDPANYYMEREWRCLANVRFELKDLSGIIIPRTFIDQFKADFPSYPGTIRPSW